MTENLKVATEMIKRTQSLGAGVGMGKSKSTDASYTEFSASCYSLQIKQKIKQ